MLFVSLGKTNQKPKTLSQEIISYLRLNLSVLLVFKIHYKPIAIILLVYIIVISYPIYLYMVTIDLFDK